MGESALGLIAYLITAGLVVVVLFLWIRQQLRLAYSSDQIRNSDPRYLAGSASRARDGWTGPLNVAADPYKPGYQAIRSSSASVTVNNASVARAQPSALVPTSER